MASEWDEILYLVHDAWPFSDREVPGGARNEEIDAFAARNGLRVPDELREWLRLCNGPLVGGGIYGIPPCVPFCNMEKDFDFHPEWRERQWFPIAGDECGDVYILDASETYGALHPVYFIDHEIYDGEAHYVVASGLKKFLRFLLEEEIAGDAAFERGEEHDGYWPFNAERVLAEDPELRNYRGPVPLAWEEDKREGQS